MRVAVLVLAGITGGHEDFLAHQRGFAGHGHDAGIIRGGEGHVGLTIVGSYSEFGLGVGLSGGDSHLEGSGLADADALLAFHEGDADGGLRVHHGDVAHGGLAGGHRSGGDFQLLDSLKLADLQDAGGGADGGAGALGPVHALHAPTHGLVVAVLHGGDEGGLLARLQLADGLDDGHDRGQIAGGVVRRGLNGSGSAVSLAFHGGGGRHQQLQTGLFVRVDRHDAVLVDLGLIGGAVGQRPAPRQAVLIAGEAGQQGGADHVLLAGAHGHAVAVGVNFRLGRGGDGVKGCGHGGGMVAGLVVFRADRAGNGEQALTAVGEGVLRSGGQADDGLVDLIGLEDRNSIALFILPGHGSLILGTIADSRHRGLALFGGGHAIDAEVVHFLRGGQLAKVDGHSVAHQRTGHGGLAIHIGGADGAQTVAAGQAGEVHHGLVALAGAEGAVVRQAGRPGDVGAVGHSVGLARSVLPDGGVVVQLEHRALAHLGGDGGSQRHVDRIAARNGGLGRKGLFIIVDDIAAGGFYLGDDLLASIAGGDGVAGGSGSRLLAADGPRVLHAAGGRRFRRVDLHRDRLAHLRLAADVLLGAFVIEVDAGNILVLQYSAGSSAGGGRAVVLQRDADLLAHIVGGDGVGIIRAALGHGADLPQIQAVCLGQILRVGHRGDHVAHHRLRHGEGHAVQGVLAVHRAGDGAGHHAAVDTLTIGADIDRLADMLVFHRIGVAPAALDRLVLAGNIPVVQHGVGSPGLCRFGSGGQGHAHHRSIAVQRHLGQVDHLHRLAGSAFHRTGALVRAGGLHGDDLAHIKGGRRIGSAGAHLDAVHIPDIAGGGAAGGHGSGDRLTHHGEGRAQFDFFQFQRVGDLGGHIAGGLAGKIAGAGGVDLDLLAGIGSLHHIGGFLALFHTGNAPAIGDGRGGRRNDGLQNVTRQRRGMVGDGVDNHHASNLAFLGHRLGQDADLLPRPLAGAGHFHADLMARIGGGGGVRRSGAQLGAAHLVPVPLIGHRGLRRRNGRQQGIAHQRILIIELHLGQGAVGNGGGSGRRRGQGDELGHHIAHAGADHDPGPLALVAQNGQRRAIAVQAQTAAVRRGAQPRAQAVARIHGSGAQRRSAGRAAAAAGNQELAHHVAAERARLNARPDSSLLQHGNDRAGRQRGLAGIAGAGAKAQTHPVLVAALHGRIAGLCQRGAHGRHGQQNRSQQQCDDDLLHSPYPSINSVSRRSNRQARLVYCDNPLQMIPDSLQFVNRL